MLRLVFFCGFKSVSTLVSTLASWVSGPSEVDDCIKADTRVSDHPLTVLATRPSKGGLPCQDVGLQRIHINDLRITTFISAVIPMASALSFCLLTQINFDNRPWCTHNLVANKSDVEFAAGSMYLGAFGKS